MIAATPPDVIKQKLVQFKWPWQDVPSNFIHWATFYLCKGCVKEGETKIAGMMRNDGIDGLGFLEWHRGPGKDKPAFQVPDELIGSGMEGPSKGNVSRSYRPIQHSSIIDPNTGKGAVKS
jgi:hypothetical protein